MHILELLERVKALEAKVEAMQPPKRMTAMMVPHGKGIEHGEPIEYVPRTMMPRARRGGE